MPTIHLSAEAYSALRASTSLSISSVTAEGRVVDQFVIRQGDTANDLATRQPDGSFLVQLSRETHSALAARCGPGESYSQTILRVLALANSFGGH